MLKNKKVLAIIAAILLVVGVSIIFLAASKSSEKTIDNKDTEITYEIAFKVNPLVTFKFTYKDDKAIINNFELKNDKAKEIFQDIDFKNMELNAAIELYGDKLSEKEIIFNIINVFTDWDNLEYFENNKYNINVKVVDKEYLEDIFNNTKNELILNKKYYPLKETTNYEYIIFKEDGKMIYSVDGVEMETDSDVYPHHYTLNADSLTLEGNEVRGYFGWILSHEDCTILYNRISCDYYLDTNYDLKEEFIKTEYYEIRD